MNSYIERSERMVDFSLTEEQRLLQQTARDFAEKEIRPVVDAVARMDRSKEVPWDYCRKMVKKGCELGFTKLLIPEEYGGLGRQCFDNVLVMEELGAADVGIASSYFNLNATMPMLIALGGTDKQRATWLRDMCARELFMLSSAGMEPNTAGSDCICPLPDPAIGIRTVARREGDTFIIHGAKAGFCTNAGIADAYYVMVRTDLNLPPMASTPMIYVPANTPGLTVGKKTELMGWKTAHHAEVYLDDVRVPVDNLIGEPGKPLPMMFMPYVATGLAACYVGLARAAYEYALGYAKERISWGQPIIRHQAVALKLADMLVDLQAARLMVWDAACAVDNNNMEAVTTKGPSAKSFAVDVAIKNAGQAVKILGGYGVAEEYRTSTFLKDAWIGYPCDITKDMLRLNMIAMLTME